MDRVMVAGLVTFFGIVASIGAYILSFPLIALIFLVIAVLSMTYGAWV